MQCHAIQVCKYTTLGINCIVYTEPQEQSASPLLGRVCAKHLDYNQISSHTMLRNALAKGPPTQSS